MKNIIGGLIVFLIGLGGDGFLLFGMGFNSSAANILMVFGGMLAIAGLLTSVFAMIKFIGNKE